jgi:hypothetical protein
MEAMDAAYNILVAIRSIIAATDAKAKIRPHLFGLSGKSKTGKNDLNVKTLYYQTHANRRRHL